MVKPRLWARIAIVIGTLYTSLVIFEHEAAFTPHSWLVSMWRTAVSVLVGWLIMASVLVAASWMAGVIPREKK